MSKEEDVDKQYFSNVLTELDADSLHLMWWAFGISFNEYLDMPDSVKFDINQLAIKVYNDKKFARSIF